MEINEYKVDKAGPKKNNELFNYNNKTTKEKV